MSPILTEEQLDRELARPYPETVEMMRRLEGDIMILGVGGKMGPSLAMLALEACKEAQSPKRVIGVSRFSDKDQRRTLERSGVETLSCDLLDPEQVSQLPKVQNVIFMAGQKFGSIGMEPMLWAMNTVVPHNVAVAFKDSRIVAFSTGCVYAFTSPESGGSKESDEVVPVGEYANSCLGRERIFEFYARRYGTRVLFYRLNYSIDLRYGVLVDIAEKVFSGRPVDLSVGTVNVIWQGDANNRALLSLDHVANPPAVLNVTGRDMLAVNELAAEFGKRFGIEPSFTGSDRGAAYLSNAKKSCELFGDPRMEVPAMIDLVAEWISGGGRRLGKPTHFSVTDGQFLDKK